MREEHALRPLMRPRSIAVIGASPRGNRGTVILGNIRRFGFQGQVYAINPKYQEIAGTPCYPSLAALPEVPEFVAVALPAEASVAAVAEAAAAGVRAGLLIAGGFSEGGGGGQGLQQRIAAICRDSGMRICGPNCYGIVNVHHGSAPYSGGVVEPLVPGNVAFVLQSGAVTHALHDSLIGRGVGISNIVTSGNEAVVELSEYVDWMLDDPATDVVALFIEGLRNPVRFAAVAQKALAMGKPIVALKVGRTERGQRATLAHTGSVAGSDEALEGLFRKHGVIRAEDMDDLRETLVLLSVPRRPKGTGFALASISGGLTTMLTDMAETAGLETPAPSEATRARLAEALPEFGVANNPLDTTGALAERAEILGAVTDAFLSDPAISGFAFALNTPLGTGAHRARARILAEAQSRTDKPVVCFSVVSAGIDPELVATLREAGIPFLIGARETILALRRWAWLGARQAAMAADRGRLADGSGLSLAVPPGEAVLTEHAATSLLARAGLPFVAQGRAATAAEAGELAAKLGFPVALKIDSPDVAHKTESGGVKLGLRNAQDVEAAFSGIMDSVRRYAPQARLDGVLVQKMAPKGLEVFLGVIRHGPFGLQLAVGPGGTLVELLKQVSLRPLPITAQDAEEMIAETMLDRLLAGVRGSGPYDRQALVAAMLALSDAGCALESRLSEVDVNPLLVLPQGEGACAVDALVVLRAAGT